MKKLGNILLGIITVILLFILTLSLTLRNEFSKDNLTNIIKETDFSLLLNEIDESDKEVLDDVEEVLTYIGIPEKVTSKILNSNGTKNFISEYLNSFTRYIIYKEDVSLTINDFKNLIKDNLDIIQKELPGKDVLEEYEENVYKFLDDHEEEILSYFPRPKDILKDVDFNDVEIYNDITLEDLLNFINFFTSNSFIITLNSIIAVIIIIIILLNQKIAWMKTLFSIGLTYSILNAIIFGGMAFLKSCLTDEDIVVNIIKYLVDSISTNILYSLIIALVISIIFIVVYNIVKPKIKN